eukprot:m.379923 g.379923  ORF g.379923 m.379923 type:complete len:210 (+) comp56221_c0_seq3:153-782(+)
MFDDLIEHTREHSFQYQEYFLNHLITYLEDPEPDIRQASVYGVGMMALYGGHPYVSIIKESIPTILAVINHPQSRTPSNANSTENAIATAVKICRNPLYGIPEEQSVPLIADWLPLTEDDEEAEYVYDYLCELIERDNEQIFQLAALAKVLAAFGTVVNSTFLPATENVCKRMVTALRHVQVSTLDVMDCPLSAYIITHRPTRLGESSR